MFRVPVSVFLVCFPKVMNYSVRGVNWTSQPVGDKREIGTAR